MRIRKRLVAVGVGAAALVVGALPADAAITQATFYPCITNPGGWIWKANFRGNVGANNYFSYSTGGVFQAVKSGTGQGSYYAVGTPGFVREKNNAGVTLSTRNYVESSSPVSCT